MSDYGVAQAARPGSSTRLRVLVLTGIVAATRLKATGSTAKVVFVTMHHDREFVEESSALGAVGFVVKDRLVSDLMPAIRSVLAGRSFVSPSLLGG